MMAARDNNTQMKPRFWIRVLFFSVVLVVGIFSPFVVNNRVEGTVIYQDGQSEVEGYQGDIAEVYKTSENIKEMQRKLNEQDVKLTNITSKLIEVTNMLTDRNKLIDKQNDVKFNYVLIICAILVIGLIVIALSEKIKSLSQSLFDNNEKKTEVLKQIKDSVKEGLNDEKTGLEGLITQVSDKQDKIKELFNWFLKDRPEIDDLINQLNGITGQKKPDVNSANLPPPEAIYNIKLDYCESKYDGKGFCENICPLYDIGMKAFELHDYTISYVHLYKFNSANPCIIKDRERNQIDLFIKFSVKYFIACLGAKRYDDAKNSLSEINNLVGAKLTNLEKHHFYTNLDDILTLMCKLYICYCAYFLDVDDRENALELFRNAVNMFLKYIQNHQSHSASDKNSKDELEKNNELMNKLINELKSHFNDVLTQAELNKPFDMKRVSALILSSFDNMITQ